MPPGNTTDSHGLARDDNSKRIFLSYASKDMNRSSAAFMTISPKPGSPSGSTANQLMARGLSFPQEIKDAIHAEVDRVIYVGGCCGYQWCVDFRKWSFGMN
jgi:hypothetical protein